MVEAATSKSEPVRVGINGFGQIGREFAKCVLESKNGVEIVAINSRRVATAYSYYLRHDSVRGEWNHQVRAEEKLLVVDDKEIPFTTYENPEENEWWKYDVDVVVEATGRFTTVEDLQKHLDAGAKKSLLTAPAKGEGVDGIIPVVNEYNGQLIICSYSCTTNAAAPVSKILMEGGLSIEDMLLLTAHGPTAENHAVDDVPGGRKLDDLCLGMSVINNFLPTTTGAAAATGKAIPELRGRSDGIAIRAAVDNASFLTSNSLLKEVVTADQVNQIIIDACNSDRWRGVVGFTKETAPSSSFKDRPELAIVLLPLTRTSRPEGSRLLMLTSAYAHRWGFVNGLKRTVEIMGKWKPATFVVNKEPAFAQA